MSPPLKKSKTLKNTFAALLLGGFFLPMFDMPYTNFILPSIFLVGGTLFSVVMAWPMLGRGFLWLLRVPLAVLFGYASMASFPYSDLAAVLVPETWEWPAGNTETFVMADGRKAAALDSPKRIQVYSTEGKYVSGWFVPTKLGRLRIDGLGRYDGRDAILARIGERRYAVYDFAGRCAAESEGRPPASFEPGLRRVDSLEAPTPWLIRVWVDRGYALSINIPSFLGVVAMLGIEIFVKRRRWLRGEPPF